MTASRASFEVSRSAKCWASRAMRSATGSAGIRIRARNLHGLWRFGGNLLSSFQHFRFQIIAFNDFVDKTCFKCGLCVEAVPKCQKCKAFWCPMSGGASRLEAASGTSPRSTKGYGTMRGWLRMSDRNADGLLCLYRSPTHRHRTQWVSSRTIGRRENPEYHCRGCLRKRQP